MEIVNYLIIGPSGQGGGVSDSNVGYNNASGILGFGRSTPFSRDLASSL